MQTQIQEQKKSIRKTVLLVGILIISILLGQGIFSGVGTTNIRDRATKIRDKIFPAMAKSSDFRINFLEGKMTLDRMFGADAEPAIEDLRYFDSVTLAANDTLKRMMELAPDKVLTSIKTLYSQWQPTGSDLIVKKVAENAEFPDIEESWNSLVEKIEAIVQESEKETLQIMKSWNSVQSLYAKSLGEDPEFSEDDLELLVDSYAKVKNHSSYTSLTKNQQNYLNKNILLLKIKINEITKEDAEDDEEEDFESENEIEKEEVAKIEKQIDSSVKVDMNALGDVIHSHISGTLDKSSPLRIYGDYALAKLKLSLSRGKTSNGQILSGFKEKRKTIIAGLNSFYSTNKDSSIVEIKNNMNNWLAVAEVKIRAGLLPETITIPDVSGITGDVLAYVQAREKEVQSEFESIVAQAVSFLFVTLGIFVVLLLVMSGFIRFASRIAKSLRKLSEDANAIKDGDLEREVIQDRNDEIGVLQVNFDLMRQEVKDFIENLDQKVKERTREVMEEKKKVSDLLNNMRQAVFKIDEDLKAIGPVSEFSNTVFGTEIEGKSVFDFLYKDLEEGSEDWVALNSGFIAVFGEDELQWDLSEDNFISKVTRWVGENRQEKQILHINYAPLWNEDEELQEIMLVVEDITEMERLEEEKKAQEESITIIQELSMANLEDIKGYFQASIKLIRDTQDLHMAAEFNQETLGLMFRYLHTLKGNSRIFGLSMMSSVVHSVENYVTRLLNAVKDDEAISTELVEKIRAGLIDSFQMLSRYADVATSIFKIDSGFQRNLRKDFLQNAVQYDHYALHLEQDDGDVESQVKKGIRIFESLKDNALIFGQNDIVNYITQMNESSQEIMLRGFNSELRENFLLNLNQFRKEVFALYSEQPNPVNHDASGLVKLVMTLVQLSKYEDVSDSENATAQTLIENASSLCKVKNFQFLGFLIDKMDSAKKNEYSQITDAIWLYIRLLFRMDIKSFLDPEDVDTLIMQINSGSQQVEEYINKSLYKEHFSFKLLRSLIKEGESLNDLLVLLTGVEPQNAAEELIKIKGFDFGQMLELIGGVSFREDQAHGFNSTEIDTCGDLCGLIKSLMNHSMVDSPLLAMIDVYTLLYDYTLLHEVVQQSAETTRKINAANFTKLEQAVVEMEESEDKKLLNSIIQKLSEPDVKTSFFKYSAMIDDLSRRLEKKIRYKVIGDNVSLDHERLTLLHDAMVHMIRNSLDHAIETVEERIEADKPEEGIVEVSFREKDNGFVLTLKDDGRGIDGERLYAKAISSGQISSEQKMTNKDKQMLIFMANLSSKEEVSELSGRGVGMDVVKANIEKVGATLDMMSELGKGTEFIITF